MIKRGNQKKRKSVGEQILDSIHFLQSYWLVVIIIIIFTFFVKLSEIPGAWTALTDFITSSGRARQHLTREGIEFSEDRFFDRVRRDDLEAVRLFLKAGIRINARDDFGNTALIIAASDGWSDLVDLLLKSGANVNSRNKAGSSALLSALATKHYRDAIRLLIQKPEVNLKDEEAHTPLICAIESGDVQIIRSVIKLHADVNEAGFGERSPLTNAVSHNRSDIVVLLLSSGANPNEAGRVENPLKVATENGNLDLVKLLIKRGGDINLKGDGGRTAIFFARAQVLRFLLASGADLKIRIGEYGMTCLMEHVIQGDTDGVRALIATGANINAAESGTHMTALKYAVQTHHPDIAAILRQAGAKE